MGETMLQSDLRSILELQGAWDRTNTRAMRARGQLVRHGVPSVLSRHQWDLAPAIGVPADDVLCEGSDGHGFKARIPWVRVASRRCSPDPTGGLMAVYLWAFPPENAVYVSLLQGIHDAEALKHGELVRKPLAQLRQTRMWGQHVVASWAATRDDLVPLRLRDVGASSLGRGYELGAIASVRYQGEAIPDDDRLLADLLGFSHALGELYRAEPVVASPEISTVPSVFARLAPSPPSVLAGIQAGCTVTAIDLDRNQERTWTLAGSPGVGVISVESPIAQALLGRSSGDTVAVTTPGGVRRYLIKSYVPVRSRPTPPVAAAPDSTA